MSDARCAGCGQTATCYGAYEGAPSSYACDDCCGHGCEDGRCEPVTATTLALATARDDVLRAAKERRRLDIELAPDHHRTLTDAEWREWCILRNQRDAARVIEDAAVDRWQKLEGSR